MTPTPGGELDQLNNTLADPLLTIVAHLAKNQIEDAFDAPQLSDLVECDFPGYAPITLTYNLDQASDEVGMGEIRFDPISFVAGAVVTEQPVTAIYYVKLYSGGTPALMQCIPFANPLVVSKAGQELNFVPYITSLAEVL